MNVETVQKIKDLGVIVSADFKWGEQCAVAAHRARVELFRLKAVLSCRKADVFIPLYKAIVRPHLEYCVQAWSPYYQKDVVALESVQRLATRLVEGQRLKTYEQRLISLGLFSLRRRRLRGDLIETFKALKGLGGVESGDFSSFAPILGTRGHSLKLAGDHCRLDCQKNFLASELLGSGIGYPSSCTPAQQ